MKKLIIILLIAFGLANNLRAEDKSYKLIKTYLLDINTNKTFGVQNVGANDNRRVIVSGNVYYIFDDAFMMYMIQLKKRITSHPGIKGDVYSAKLTNDNYNEELPIVLTKSGTHNVLQIVWSKDNVECFMY